MDLTTETDRQRLERALDADPADWWLRLLLADVLEEAGEGEAAWGQRWQARCRRVPLSTASAWPWSWWQGDGQVSILPPFRLPCPLFTIMTGPVSGGSYVSGGGYLRWRDYPTRAAAEADLARALSLLPDRGASLLPATVE